VNTDDIIAEMKRRRPLPAGWGAHGQLAFDRPTGTLVTAATTPSKRPCLFVRRLRARKYKSVLDHWAEQGGPAALKTEDVFVRTWALTHDSYVFLVLAYIKDWANVDKTAHVSSKLDSMLTDFSHLRTPIVPLPPERPPRAVVDLGFLRLDLRDFSIETWNEPALGQRQLMLSKLVASPGTEAGVYAVVAVPARKPNDRLIPYFLTSIHWETKEVRKIRRMHGVHC
jgi:hypothetical protein